MLVGLLIFLWCVLLYRSMSCAGVRVTMRASIAECFCLEPNSLSVRMPVISTASATRAARIFSKVFPRQESSEIGLWLLGNQGRFCPAWVSESFQSLPGVRKCSELLKVAKQFRQSLPMSCDEGLYHSVRYLVSTHCGIHSTVLNNLVDCFSGDSVIPVTKILCTGGRKPSGIGWGSTTFAGKNDALRVSTFPGMYFSLICLASFSCSFVCQPLRGCDVWWRSR